MAPTDQMLQSNISILGHIALFVICISNLGETGFLSKLTKVIEPSNNTSNVKQSVPGIEWTTLYDKSTDINIPVDITSNDEKKISFNLPISDVLKKPFAGLYYLLSNNGSYWLGPLQLKKTVKNVLKLIKHVESFTISKTETLSPQKAELVHTTKGKEYLMSGYIRRLTFINPVLKKEADNQAEIPVQTFIVTEIYPDTFELNIPASVIDVTLSYYVIEYAGEPHKLLVTHDWVKFECEHKYRDEEHEYRFPHWYVKSEEINAQRSSRWFHRKATPGCALCGKGISVQQNRLQCRRCMFDIHEDCARNTKDNKRYDCDPNFAQLPKIFGEELRVLAKAHKRDLPILVTNCTAAIGDLTMHELNPEELNKKTEGIYRLPGNVTDINFIVDQLDKKREVPDMTKVENLRTVAGVLKRFLNELPHPLITHAVFSAMLRDKEEWTAGSLYTHLKILPISHKHVLDHILKHLHNCKKLEEYSKMTASKLSAVVSPCFVGKSDDIDLIQKGNEIVTTMIKNYTELYVSSVTA